MARSKSSRRWLDRQLSDEYVARAQREGYRSRAVYKLLEIHHKDRILKPGLRVVDLGAAPGGWSQVAREQVGDHGQVVALDILSMPPIEGVLFIQGDFQEPGPMRQLLDILGSRRADLVLSDMAPNLTGIAAIDQPRAMYLSELARDFCADALKPGGSLVVKLFQGEGFDAYVRDLRTRFQRVVSRKPKASRPASREVYLVAQGYKALDRNQGS